MNSLDVLAKTGLYRPEFEHDNCGFGLIAQIDGESSHQLVKSAVQALARMTHRGLAEKARRTLVEKVESRQLTVNGWRSVPVNVDACGREATKSMPDIEQLFVTAPRHMDTAEFNRNLFVARRKAEIELRSEDPDFFVCSLSADVILYKGLMMPARLPEFYEDLNDPTLKSRIAVFHQRFSTNTMPQWRLAQPFRYLAHNGEINTIRGNRNWANARASKFHSELLPELQELQPLVTT